MWLTDSLSIKLCALMLAEELAISVRYNSDTKKKKEDNAKIHLDTLQKRTQHIQCNNQCRKQA